jgi:hypothetical protein
MTPALRRYDGLRRLGWAVFAEGLLRAAEGAIACRFLALAEMLLRASKMADQAAFPKARV